ncbi:hypothetical protein KGF56_002230 [Candida oxycetoniae]|uniref:NFACT RNA-binding domain-containing protein n=1 Tax=Candida oxycetoniae TaxID=497107 RepID=A0AAI9SY24_9ASCO|nr:uncharacterized protein KGF56_002230 [Candida oxycetoniae]KAI3404979.2 hypothetical protein KGF56_002230 [Candida oxycetoniae]
MGKDKYENESLIEHSHRKNIWFHVDNLSSAHVYLQLTKEEILDWKSFDTFHIDQQLLSQICQLTKANSIKGNKLDNVKVIYTPCENLHTDGSMDTGTVIYKNPKLVKRFNVVKRQNAVINKLNKTKRETSTDEFIKSSQKLVNEIELERKKIEKEEEKLNRMYEREKKQNQDPYGDLFTSENMQQQSKRSNFEEDFW